MEHSRVGAECGSRGTFAPAGIEAGAERSLRITSGRHQVDVLAEVGEYAVTVEAECAPAEIVLADAEERLPTGLLTWRGLTVDLVYAFVSPADLRNVPESRARESLAASDALEFSLVERRDELGSPPDSPQTTSRSSRVPSNLDPSQRWLSISTTTGSGRPRAGRLRRRLGWRQQGSNAPHPSSSASTGCSQRRT